MEKSAGQGFKSPRLHQTMNTIRMRMVFLFCPKLSDREFSLHIIFIFLRIKNMQNGAETQNQNLTDKRGLGKQEGAAIR
ncbi:hypothetical protein B1748_08870 [Paenibacillus sp. MY03]|nr:hypothetical protein B1748_08870 [Paenibacillus sp. MY03]